MLIFALSTLLIAASVLRVWAVTDTTGGASSTAAQGAGFAYGFPITITQTGTLQSIGINWPTAGTRNVLVALYSAGSGKPANLLAQSSSTPNARAVGWQDIPVTFGSTLTAGSYWVAAQISNTQTIFYQPSTESYYSKSFGLFDASWSIGSTQFQSNGNEWNMRVTYSTDPPPSDFTISANSTSQSVGAGSTASYTLTIQYGAGFSSTVNLAVTSGCPSGVTCTVTPNSVSASGTATLNVPTLITTPSGTTSVTVTASSTSPSLSHPVTVQLTVTGRGRMLRVFMPARRRWLSL